MDNKTRILLVEDEKDLSIITCKQLSKRGYEAIPAYNVAEAIEAVKTKKIDLVLMDVMLPDGDGNDAVVQIRSNEIGYKGPVIFLSCIGDGASIVESFRNGGNDYLIKPVKIDDLTSRIEENLKLWSGETKKSKNRFFKNFAVDKQKHEVRLVKDGNVGEVVSLSPTEYKILEIFVEKPNEIILYSEIYRRVWEMEFLEDTKTVMVHVSNLRKKLDPDGIGFIKAIRSVGYIFEEN